MHFIDLDEEPSTGALSASSVATCEQELSFIRVDIKPDRNHWSKHPLLHLLRKARRSPAGPTETIRLAKNEDLQLSDQI